MDINSPWKGLRSYKEADAEFFFGRNAEIETLSEKIQHNLLTIVYGPSGTGKTSILRAGVFPKLRSARYFPVYVKLHHDLADAKSGDSPTYLQQIMDIFQNVAAENKYEIEQNIPYVVEGKCQSLWEYFHCNRFWTQDDYPLYPILVLDQFEEIFTLPDAKKGKDYVQQFFAQLADLSENWIPDYIRVHLSEQIVDYPETTNYRCVISQREDFLARLEEQTLNYPSFKLNRFGLQPLNEEQALEVITRPIPGLFDDEVAGKIIEKVTNRIFKKDFLLHDEPEIDVEPALLSLFCDELNNLRLKKGLDIITEDVIDKFGNNIIRDFYYDAMDEVEKMTSPSVVEYLEKELLTSDNFRNNISQKDAERHHGLTPKAQHYLIKTKRILRVETWGAGRDRKHESRRLLFTHDVLCDIARKHRQEREEKEKQRNLEEATRKAKLAEEKAQKLRIRHYWTLGMILVCLVSLGTFFYFGYYHPYEERYAQYIKINGWPYGVGEKLSKDECKSISVYYCLQRKGFLDKSRLWWGEERHFNEVTIKNSYGDIATAKTAKIFSPLFRYDEESLSRPKFSEICRWKFEGEKYVTKETAFTFDGSIAYVLSYMRGVVNTRPSEVKSNKRQATCEKVEGIEKNATAVFEDENGRAIKIRNNGADRMVISYDSIGREEQYRFYDEFMCPQENYYADTYGCNITYDKENRITCITNCDAFGDPLNSRSSSMIQGIRYSYDNNKGIHKTDWTKCILAGSIVEERGYDTEIRKYSVNTIVHTFMLNGIETENSYLKCKSYTETFDKRGNIVEEMYKGHNTDRPTLVLREYDKNGRSLSIKAYADSEEKIVFKQDSLIDRPYYWLSKTEYAYDELGNIQKEVRISGNDTVYIFIKEDVTDNHSIIKRRDVLNNCSGYIQDIEYDSLHRIKQSSFLSESGEPIMQNFIREGEDEDSLYCSSISFDYGDIWDKVRNDSVRYEVRTLRDKDGKLCKEPFAKDSCVYDKDDLLRYRVSFNPKGEIELSYMFYYSETGVLNGQSVLGVEGKAIRCPNWDAYDWIYYKLMTIYDSKGVPFKYKVTNELGSDSYLTNINNTGFNLWYSEEMHSVSEFVYKTQDLGAGMKRLSLQSLAIQKYPLLNKDRYVYLHLTNAKGITEKGVRDGDILIRLGDNEFIPGKYDAPAFEKKWQELRNSTCNAKVLRLEGDKYKPTDVMISPTLFQWIEYHLVYTDDKEWAEISCNL